MNWSETRRGGDFVTSWVSVGFDMVDLVKSAFALRLHTDFPLSWILDLTASATFKYRSQY